MSVRDDENFKMDLREHEVLYTTIQEFADKLRNWGDLYVVENEQYLKDPEDAQLVMDMHDQLARLIEGIVPQAVKLDRKLLRHTAELFGNDPNEAVAEYAGTYPQLIIVEED